MTEHLFNEIKEKFTNGFFEIQNGIIPNMESFELGYEQIFHVKINAYRCDISVNIICNVVSENPIEIYYEIEGLKFESPCISCFDRKQKKELEDIMNN